MWMESPRVGDQDGSGSVSHGRLLPRTNTPQRLYEEYFYPGAKILTELNINEHWSSGVNQYLRTGTIKCFTDRSTTDKGTEVEVFVP